MGCSNFNFHGQKRLSYRSSILKKDTPSGHPFQYDIPFIHTTLSDKFCMATVETW